MYTGGCTQHLNYLNFPSSHVYPSDTINLFELVDAAHPDPTRSSRLLW